tara:strand:- start:4309 stop:4422 length:114 start_codon:yes stop_codon:yes gene_type:complete
MIEELYKKNVSCTPLPLVGGRGFLEKCYDNFSSIYDE